MHEGAQKKKRNDKKKTDEQQICAQCIRQIAAILGRNAYFQLPILLKYNFITISIFCW